MTNHRSGHSLRYSDAEWSIHLPRICELYYGMGRTLEDTRLTMQREMGFYATSRMYKDRVRDMAIPPKKLCMQKYQAMNEVAKDFRHYGASVHFICPSGFQFIKRTPAQITKQVQRAHRLRSMPLDEARILLQKSRIRVLSGDDPAVTSGGLSKSDFFTNIMETAVSQQSVGVVQDSNQPKISQSWSQPRKASRLSPAVSRHTARSTMLEQSPETVKTSIRYVLNQPLIS